MDRYSQDEDFSAIESNQSSFTDNYLRNSTCIGRRTIFTHCIKNLNEVRAKISQSSQQPSNKNFLAELDVPNITFEDDVISITKKGLPILSQIMLEKNASEVNSKIIFLLIMRLFKWEIYLSIFLHTMQMACRLGFSVMLQILFEKVSALQEGNNKKEAYLLAAFCGLLWLIGQISRHNAFYQVTLFVGRIRSFLIFLVYQKLSKISQYTAKTQQIGKIINLLSNDFNSMQVKSTLFFAGLCIPFVLGGVIAILTIRFGWPGVLIACIILIILPLQTLVSKLNGKITEKINVNKDQRIKICTQIIQGIKFIKLYGWQIAFKNIIQGLRKQEIKDYLKLAFGRSIERAIGNIAANIGGLACFILMDLKNVGGLLSTAKIFATMQLLVTLRLSVYFTGLGIGLLYQLQITFERISTILNIEDKRMILINPLTKIPLTSNQVPNTKKDAVRQMKTSEQLANNNYNQETLQTETRIYIPSRSQTEASLGEIIFKNVDVYWKADDLQTPTLKNLNMKIAKGKFIGITGKIGSGKSGLLGTILDEAPYYSGFISKKGTVAYVEQQPILFSTSVKQNIIFGSQFSHERYQMVLKMSSLDADIQLLENGDQTIVGERGITLSGGQKARLSFARALYYDADIYLLDDPISAVDSKVARKLYQNSIKRLIGNKTVILVTHQVSYLYECDELIIMQEGKIAFNDTPRNLQQKLKQLQMTGNEPKIQRKKQIVIEQFSQKKEELIDQETNIIFTKGEQKNQNKQQAQKLSITEKQQENVTVTLKSYVRYLFFSKINYFIFPICMLFFLLTDATNVMYARILSEFDNMMSKNYQTTFTSKQSFWLALGLLQLGFFIFNVIKYFLLNIVILQSNKKIHEDMIHSLLRSPSSYFDITPSGRLTNKFSNDLGILDSSLSYSLIDSIEGPITCIVLLVNVFFINIYFLIPGIISVFFISGYFIYCKKAIVEAKQLDLNLKNPVFSMVSQMISGLIQIRIFKRRFSLLKEFSQKINSSLRGNFCYWFLSRAFGAILSYLSIIIVWIGWIIGIISVKSEAAGLYGVSVVFLIQMSDSIQWFLRHIVAVQSMFVSVQRVFAITDLKSEKQLSTLYDLQNLILNQEAQNKEINSNKLRQWPQSSTIKLKNFSMRYRLGLPLVLENVNFEIKDKQKIGIVGRTGAGKSSIIQALFRISQPQQQSIYEIGDKNALEMGLHTLRQNISVIPQFPFLFKGSIKKNLDPFSARAEQELWDVLKQSNLKQAVQKLPEKLQTDVSNVAQIFSVGQKQLLCLARALLRKNKFLVLDEATSNVDMETDRFIQNCIKTKFRQTTVITIAHRLNTIADYDRLIVMDKGRVIEIGSPHELLMKNGLFSQMVSCSGRNADLIKKIAKQKFEKQ